MDSVWPYSFIESHLFIHILNQPLLNHIVNPSWKLDQRFFLTHGKSFVFHSKVGDSFRVNPHGTCGKDGTCHGVSREQVKTCGGKKKYGEKDSWGSWGSEVCRFLWKRRKQSKKKNWFLEGVQKWEENGRGGCKLEERRGVRARWDLKKKQRKWDRDFFQCRVWERFFSWKTKAWKRGDDVFFFS